MAGFVKYEDGSAAQECLITVRVTDTRTIFAADDFINHSLWKSETTSNSGFYSIDVKNIRQDPNNTSAFGFITPQNDFTKNFAYDENSSGITVTVNTRCNDTTEGSTVRTTAEETTAGYADHDVTAVAPPTFSITATTTVSEDVGAVNLTISLSSAATTTVTVDYTTADVTATLGEDYGAPGALVPVTGTVTLTVGETTTSTTIPIIDDGVDENTETFSVTLSNATGGATDVNSSADTATVTITDNDVPVVAAPTTVTAVEPGAGQTTTANVVVSLLDGVGGSPTTSDFPVTVSYETADGTATNDPDYVGQTSTLTIAAGSPSGTIQIVINGNAPLEPPETFTVTLVGATTTSTTTPLTVNPSVTTVTIVENPVLSIADVTVDEGVAGGNVTLTISMVPATGTAVTVRYDTSNSSAVAGQDYNAVVNGSATIDPNTTSTTVTVGIINDSIDEASETFKVALSNPVGGDAIISPTNGTSTVTITDNDAPPTVTPGTAASEDEGNSGNTPVDISVGLSAVSGLDVTVQYDTSNGTASSASDYDAVVGGILTIPAGSTSGAIVANGSVPLNANGDTAYEADETFTVTWTNASTASGGTQPTITNATTAVTIRNDDVPVANADSYPVTGTFLEDNTLTVASTTGVLFNDEGQGIPNVARAASLVGGTATSKGGTVSLSADGSFTYDPAPDFPFTATSDTDTFTYQFNDGRFNSNVATVTITVTNTNDAPVAVDDFYPVVPGQSINISALAGLLDNDNDVDGDNLSVVNPGSIGVPSGQGSLTVNADGSFDYDPGTGPTGFVGTTQFTYQAQDTPTGALSNVATVILSQGPTWQMTVDKTSVDEDQSTIIATILLINASTSPSTVAFNTVNGTAVGGTAAPSDYTTVSQTISLSDPAQTGDPQTSTITVTIINDPADPIREGSETFHVQLSNASAVDSAPTSAKSVISGATPDGFLTTTLAIDDPADNPVLTIDSPKAFEAAPNATATVTVTLTGKTNLTSTFSLMTMDTTSPSVLLIDLKEQNSSGQSGWAMLSVNATDSNKTDVTLKLTPSTSTAGLSSESVHIHAGQCDTLGSPAHTLTPILDGMSMTTVNASLDSLRNGDFAINSHEKDNSGNYTTCGDIPAKNKSWTITLSEQNDSGQTGYATLIDRGAQTAAVLYLPAGNLGSELVHIHSGQCGGLLGGVVHTLTSFVSGSNVSISMVDATLMSLLAGDFAINAHKKGDPGVYTACGVVADAAVGGDTDYVAISSPVTLTFGPSTTVVQSQTLTVAQNQTSGVTILDDVIDELAEIFEVKLSNPMYAKFAGGKSYIKGVVTINDNDLAPVLSVTIDKTKVNEADVTDAVDTEDPTITVTLTGGSSAGVQVTVDTSDNETTAGDDYFTTTVPALLQWAADEADTSKTLRLNVRDDALEEDFESVLVLLLNPTTLDASSEGVGLSVAAFSDLVVISDDEPVAKVVTVTSEGEAMPGDQYFLVVAGSTSKALNVSGIQSVTTSAPFAGISSMTLAQTGTADELLRRMHGLNELRSKPTTHVLLAEVDPMQPGGKITFEFDLVYTTGGTVKLNADLPVVGKRSNRNFFITFDPVTLDALNYVGLGLVPDESMIDAVLEQPVHNAYPGLESKVRELHSRGVRLKDVVETIYAFKFDTNGGWITYSTKGPITGSGPANGGLTDLKPFQGMLIKARTMALSSATGGETMPVFDWVWTPEHGTTTVPVKINVEGQFQNRTSNATPLIQALRVGFNLLAPHASAPTPFDTVFGGQGNVPLGQIYSSASSFQRKVVARPWSSMIVADIVEGDVFASAAIPFVPPGVIRPELAYWIRVAETTPTQVIPVLTPTGPNTDSFDFSGSP